jgi:preprotein translocase SecE subunit
MASGIYKSGQGYYTRMGTTVGAGLLTLLGLRWLWDYAAQVKIGTVNQTYVAFGICGLVGLVVGTLIYLYVFRKPGSGDFLIATEGEMKKVNWSTRREIVGSTTAVIIVAVILALFCWGLELFFVSTAVVIILMAVATTFIWLVDNAFVFVFQQMGVLESQ